MNRAKSIPLQDLPFDERFQVVTDATARLAEKDNIPSVEYPVNRRAILTPVEG